MTKLHTIEIMNNTNKAFLQHINSHNSHNHWFKTLNLFLFAMDLNLQTILRSLERYTDILRYTRYTDIYIIMVRIQPGKDKTSIESHYK